MKDTLYIDVDDTILANCHHGSGFDLRPGVMTQLRVLSRLFKCQWLTCWPWSGGKRMDLQTLMRNLYGAKLNQDIKYCDWATGHPLRKAGAVLAESAPKEFWWLEDPLTHEEIEALREAGKLDRYIRVQPMGMWGFVDACNELFRRASVSEADIKSVGGKPEWFQREAIVEQISSKENLCEALGMIKLISSSEHISAEDRLNEIRRFADSHIDTLY